MLIARNRLRYGMAAAAAFSLIEMMVAILIGAIVALGAVTLIVAIDQANTETIQASRINQELRALASVIGDEIKRSRRLHDPIFFVGQGGTTNGAFDFVDTSTANCIVYGYQDAVLDDGGNSAAVNNYQTIYLKTTSGVGSIVFAKGTSAVTCATTGTALNSSQVNITGLTFNCVTTDGTNVTKVANTSGADTSLVQQSCSEIDMLISATLLSGSKYEKTLTHTYAQQVFIRSGAAKSS